MLELVGLFKKIWQRVRAGRARAVARAEIPAALEKVREQIDAPPEEGAPEDALALVEGVLAAGPEGDDLVEAHFLKGQLLFIAGETRRALESYEAALALAPEDGAVEAAMGEALFELWEFEAARDVLARAVKGEPSDARAHRYLALALDRLGERERAAKHFRKAADLDRREYPFPVRVSREEFDRLARAAIDALPAWVVERLGAKISFIVEEYPRLVCVAARPEEGDPQTLGVFWGEDIAASQEQRQGPGFVPNHILLFQRNLEQFVATRAELEEEVRTTVFHEVGHYLGCDEEDLDGMGLA
jgi:predicted Zn-dependent protease with MMP-like domain